MFKNILNFLMGTPFKMGAFESPKDSRTINQVIVQVPVVLPDDYSTPTPPVSNQGPIPKCVAAAIREIKEIFLMAAGTHVDLSDDDLYAQCKAIDGIPDQAGTYPIVGAKLITSTGMCSAAVYKSGNKQLIAADRARYKLAGFIEVNPDYDSVCQAIFQYKAITASFNVDGNWFVGIITRVLKAIGRHYGSLHGFFRKSFIAQGQNHWGITWIGRVASFIDPTLAPGHFDVYWPDVADSVVDLYAFTDIPEPVLNHVRGLNFHFDVPMKFAQTSYQIVQYQKRLADEGFWGTEPFTGYYGYATEAMTLEFQMAKKIISDPSESNYGYFCGSKTLRYLNGEVSLDLVHATIQIESNGNDYAVGDVTLTAAEGGPAYGCLQIRKPDLDEVNVKLGTSYNVKDLLGNRDLSIKVWTTYFEIHTEMVTDKDKAFTWNGGAGWRQYYGRPLQKRYTAALDAYWAKIQSMMA